MRYRPPQPGDTRTITKFALLPCSTVEDHEWRWMERVTIEQRFFERSAGITMPRHVRRWENQRFVDPPTQGHPQ